MSQKIEAINCTVLLTDTTAPDHIAICFEPPAAILDMETALELSSMLENAVQEYKRNAQVDLNQLRAEGAL